MTRNTCFISRPWTTTAVGKSAILLQFTERQFRDAHDMTIGVEFGAKDVSIGDAQVCIYDMCTYVLRSMQVYLVHHMSCVLFLASTTHAAIVFTCVSLTVRMDLPPGCSPGKRWN